MTSSNLHQSELKIVDQRDLLPSINKWLLGSGLSISAIIFIACILSAVIKYPVKVTANAVIRPVGEVKVAQTNVGAAVKSIHAQENKMVTKGQLLAKLDDTQLQLQKVQLTNTINNRRLQLNRIQGEIRASESQYGAEQILAKKAINVATVELVRIQQQSREKQNIAGTEIAEAQLEVSLAQKNLNRSQLLAREGAIARQRLETSEQSLNTAKAKLQRAKMKSRPDSAEIEIAQKRIEQERVRGQSTLAVLNKEREGLLQRRDELQRQLQQDQQAYKQIAQNIIRHTIIAPETGILLKFNLRNIGQVVTPSDVVAEIVPQDTPLVVRARLSENEIGNIQLGQKVYIRVNAFPYPEYGILIGRVTELPPDVSTALHASPSRSSQPSQAKSFYNVMVELEKTFLKNDKKNQIKPGMEGTAQIITREETVLKFLLRKAKFLIDP